VIDVIRIPMVGSSADDDQTTGDAALLMSIVSDNERWTGAGIATADLSVVFEMSARCGWGAEFNIRRFRRALRVLVETRGAIERGGRWYLRNSAALLTVDQRGARICARPGCGRDISELQTNARYCSDGCRNRARRRRHQTSTIPVHRPTSAPCDVPENHVRGGSGRSTRPPVRSPSSMGQP